MNIPAPLDQTSRRVSRSSFTPSVGDDEEDEDEDEDNDYENYSTGEPHMRISVRSENLMVVYLSAYSLIVH